MSYSVIIPSYQRPEMLARALRSVYAQTVLPEAIYLVVDEVEDWKRYAFLNEEFDGRLKTTFTGGGFGGARARNAGLDQAQEEFVFFLDDDDEWLPTKIEKQIALLRSRPDAVGVTCGRTEIVAGESSRVDVLTNEVKLNRRVRAENLTGSFSQFGFRCKDLSGYRLVDELPAGQDFEFYMRVADAGRIVVVSECLVKYHRHGEGCITGSLAKKIEAYSMIERLHASRSSKFDVRFRRYQLTRLKLSADVSLPCIFCLSLKTLRGGVLCGEPVRAFKSVLKGVWKYFYR
jgi:glycosyltransferase involved in cell wall biosynthesis